jgi:hypothetical protein
MVLPTMGTSLRPGTGVRLDGSLVVSTDCFVYLVDASDYRRQHACGRRPLARGAIETQTETQRPGCPLSSDHDTWYLCW